MTKVRWVALCATVTLALAGTTAAAGARSTSSKEKPAATDIGITPKEIHIAVIADVDNPIAPPALVCSTKDEHPQTYQANVGRGR
jgi:hypothetical protein